MLLSSLPSSTIVQAAEDYKPVYIHLSWNDDTETTVAISWKTANETATIVQYGIQDVTEHEIGGISGTWHHIKLTDLSPGTRYKYRVGNGEIWSEVYSFTTNLDGGHARFVVWGDSRTDRVARRAVVQAVAPVYHDFSIFTGDLVENGGKTTLWNRWFSDFTPELVNHPIMPLLGNHEENSSNYYNFFQLPGKEEYYSFDFGSAHFIILHSCVARYGGTFDEQVEWLLKDLEANKDAEWIFVADHRPFFASSSTDDGTDLRETFLPILDKYNVTAVFSGHKHYYERLESNNITFVIAGGAGAPLYKPVPRANESVYAESTYHFTLVDLYPNQLRFQAFRTGDYSLMDAFTINKVDLPDLRIDMLPMDYTHFWNESLKLKVAITNVGEENITVSTKAKIMNSYDESWEFTVPALNVGEQHVYELEWSAPEPAVSQWTVQLDTENQIPEVVEENNLLIFNVNSSALPITETSPTAESPLFSSNLVEAAGLASLSLATLVIIRLKRSKKK